MTPILYIPATTGVRVIIFNRVWISMIRKISFCLAKLAPYKDSHKRSSRHGLAVSILLLRHSCTRLCYLLLGHSDVLSIVSAHNSHQCLRCVPGWGWSSSQTPTALADGGFACYFTCQGGPEAFRSTPAASSLCKTPLQKCSVCRRRPSFAVLGSPADQKGPETPEVYWLFGKCFNQEASPALGCPKLSPWVNTAWRDTYYLQWLFKGDEKHAHPQCLSCLSKVSYPLPPP